MKTSYFEQRMRKCYEPGGNSNHMEDVVVPDFYQIRTTGSAIIIQVLDNHSHIQRAFVTST